MSGVVNDPPTAKLGLTARLLAEACHFQGVAKSFDLFLKAAAKEDLAQAHAADLLRSTYENLCEVLTDAQRLTGNREVEMAEVIADLQRLKEDYRELLP